MATKKQDYGNDSISALKGADRVRKRPGVIFPVCRPVHPGGGRGPGLPGGLE